MTDTDAEEHLTIQQHQWQTLPLIAILYFSFHLLRQIIGQFIYLIPALLIGYSTIIDNLPRALTGALILLVVVLAISWLKFHFYRFRLSDEHIQIRSGILSKKHLDLPFHRIHNVKLEQPIFYRPGNHTCVILDTAGSSKDEAKIFALPMAQALSLKSAIVNFTSPPTTGTDAPQNEGVEPSASVAQPQEVELNRRSLSDLVIHGITSNRIWIFLGGLAPFFDNIFEWLAEQMMASGLDLEAMLDPAEQPLWQYSLTLLTLIILTMLILTLFSVLGAIISFYGYRFSRLHDRYIRRSGLFTRHEVSMQRSRLQMLVRKQDWLDRLIGRINLKLEQFNANVEHGQMMMLNNKIIVPSIKADECQALLKDIYPYNRLCEIDYQSIDRRFLWRHMFFALLLHAGIALLLTPQIMAFLLTGLSLLLVSALIYQRWKRWGFAIDNNFVYIRKGLFGVDYYSFALSKIQQTKFTQSIWMRPYNLCSVTLVLACGGQRIPFIRCQQGRQIINVGLYEVEANNASWM